MYKVFKHWLWSMLTLAALWLAGLLTFLLAVPMQPASVPDSVRVAVVLTGGKGRIDEGLRLLGEGKIDRLFISGVNEEATPHEVLSAAKIRMQSEFPTLKTAQIDIGYDATSTIGNADETRLWLKKNHITSFALITANYHLPRSQIEFGAVLTREIRMVAVPVLVEDFTRLNWWKSERGQRLVLSEYHKCLASIVRHLLIRLERSA